jgi:soluble lytic murein transglycosylase-like protein
VTVLEKMSIPSPCPRPIVGEALNRGNVLCVIALALDLSAVVIILALISKPVPKPAAEPLEVVEVAKDMPKGEILVPPEYRELLNKACNDAGVPYAIMARMVQVESGWDSTADNGYDAGLFQFNRKYLEWFSLKFNGGRMVDPFDPVVSAKVACRYMRWLYFQLGDYRKAVAAYNCGLTRFNTGKLPRTTVLYVKLVFGD